MGNKKQVRTINRRHGKDWWAEQGRKPHKRGANFNDPVIREKAIETRKRNREAVNEIQTDTDV